jgi:hypothetical protein
MGSEELRRGINLEGRKGKEEDGERGVEERDQ